jgi:hypothetical protein
LRGADLSGAKEWNKEQLRQAKSLDGAIMPDGQLLRGLHVYFRNQPTFEAWLKDIKSREDDKDQE